MLFRSRVQPKPLKDLCIWGWICPCRPICSTGVSLAYRGLQDPRPHQQIAINQRVSMVALLVMMRIKRTFRTGLQVPARRQMRHQTMLFLMTSGTGKGQTTTLSIRTLLMPLI